MTRKKATDTKKAKTAFSKPKNYTQVTQPQPLAKHSKSSKKSKLKVFDVLSGTRVYPAKHNPKAVVGGHERE